jgi:hypothetical protein
MTNSQTNKTETSFLRHGAKGPAFLHLARAEEQLEKVPPDQNCKANGDTGGTWKTTKHTDELS